MKNKFLIFVLIIPVFFIFVMHFRQLNSQQITARSRDERARIEINKTWLYYRRMLIRPQDRRTRAVYQYMNASIK